MEYPQITQPYYHTYSVPSVPEKVPLTSPPSYYAGEKLEPNPPKIQVLEPTSPPPSSYSTFKGVLAGISTFTILEVIRTIFF